MVWEQVSVTTPHIAYATTGFALILFGTISLFIKEKLYIGEANVATIYGLIVGPHCLKWFDPSSWGNSDYITLELSRIVLVVQIFAVAVELPKKYMLKHWLSVLLLLVPVMTFGWMLSSVFIWKLVPTLRWIEALAIAACVTATDPVLASAVVGKGKFAKRVPGHLRNILSAESGCNDGMAFPFVYLALNVMKFEHHASEIAMHFICISVLYECVLGCLIGVVIGYGGRHLIKFAEKKKLIDRESFLVYYFCLALFCAGVGTLTGTDDLLVAFAAGAAFSWDGWFARKTEETHVSNVIDLLINTAYFIYFGAIVPWPQFNNAEIGIRAWKLVIIAILVLIFRRLPIVLFLKPIIPDIKTWREALFSGHFGPIGVGGLFVAILARAEMEENGTIPLRELPPPDHPHYYAIACIWPIVCFLVISSIIVHGSSIAVFTLGKRLNNIAITMTYTYTTNTTNTGPSWIKRLNNRNGGNIRLERIGTRYSEADSAWSEGGTTSKRKPKLRTRKKGGRRDLSKVPANLQVDLSDGTRIEKSTELDRTKLNGQSPEDLKVYREGANIVVEDRDGNVVDKLNLGKDHHHMHSSDIEKIKLTQQRGENDAEYSTSSEETKYDRRPDGRHVQAYQVGDEVIVENEDGEVIKRYRVIRDDAAPSKNVGPIESAGSEDSNNVMNNARKWFRRASASNHAHTPQDKENATLVPIDQRGHDVEAGGDHEEMRQRIETAFREDNIRDITKPETPNVEVPAGAVEDAGEEEDEDDVDDEEVLRDGPDVSDEEIPFQGGDDDDDDGETEVERARRMAALGMTDGDDAISDTEEVDPSEPRHRRINTIPEEDQEEEDKEDEPRIQFHLPEKH